MRFMVLQHHRAEGLGNIEQWFTAQGFSWSIYQFEQLLPTNFDAFDGIIVLGGPMHADESNPRLRQELGLIEHFIKQQKPTLGICLGAQLVAYSLGASILPMAQEECGWLPITTTDNQCLQVAQWHEQQCNLPDGAILLASSDLCRVQMFSYQQHVLATQFHPEWNNCAIEQLQTVFGAECPLVKMEPERQEVQNWWFEQLSRWIKRP